MTKFETHIKNIKTSVDGLEGAITQNRYQAAVQEAVEIQKTLTELVNKILSIKKREKENK